MVSATMPTRESIERKPEVSLEQILDKCCDLMAEKGFHGTSMRDLSRATGRSLSGLYHYFNNKEELYYLIHYRGYKNLLESAQRKILQETTPQRKLYQFISNHMDFLSKNASNLKVMMLGIKQDGALKKNDVDVLRQKYQTLAQNLVRDWIKKLKVCGAGDEKVEIYARCLFGMMNGVEDRLSIQGSNISQELAEEIYGLFTGGLNSVC